MKPQSEPSTQEVLAGLVERVTFHNAENGFCVLRAKARGHRDVVTVVGHAATIAAGEWVTASGEWVNDRTHGQQFNNAAGRPVARAIKRCDTASLAALKRYLTAKPARLAEDYRAIPLVPQALDAFGVTTDCLRPRLIS